ncbi:MAG TPA: alkaline phosphatase family protein [Acidobacteriaceae bacterium]|nr:alkaline phosphatase family protein [Acidobacteriaceae bacterium]
MKYFCLLACALLAAGGASAFATVTVSSPAANSTVHSPVTYIASATTSTCSKGVASMGIYIDNKLTYTHQGTSLDTSLAFNPGTYDTVVEEWDHCGGASYVHVPITVTSASGTAGVTVITPAPNSTVTSPVTYDATATTSTCSQGVASMGIYVDNKLIYTHQGASLDTQITLNPGAEHTVVEEWDHCGGAAYTTINLTVASSTAQNPTVGITANPTSVASGSPSTLTVTATNATTVTVTGGGNTYSVPAAGGTLSVSPAETTTYTAEATSSTANASASASATVNVIAVGSLQSIDHVVFMLQENHTFDSYFGMLNPYRGANGWNIGDDGKNYAVDGVDDKLSTISNEDDEGTSYPLFKFTTTCIDDASSDWLASYGDVNRYNFTTARPINMDGFVHNAEGYAKACVASGTCSGKFTDTTGQRAMGYYDQTYLNYYYYMASQFALSDRWFSPVSSKSVANRLATFTGGTTQGLVEDPSNDDHLGVELNIPTIFEELEQANVSWKIYYTSTMGYCLADEGECSGGTDANFPATWFTYFSYHNQFLYQNPSHAACTGTTQSSTAVGDTSASFCIDTTHIAPLTTYYTDLQNGTLPSFSFIESGSGLDDEHPGSAQSILLGQLEVSKVINAFMASPEWSNSVFFFSYDEGGGPYDHVPPVPGHSNQNTDATLGSAALSSVPDISSIAVNADSDNPCVPAGGKPTLHCDVKAGYPGASSSDAAAQQGFAAQLGFRLPNMVISPFDRKHYVSHIPMDHTAIIRFVENRFIGSSAYLTNRDKAQPNLLDFFDFTDIPWATPPTPPAPVTAGSLGDDPCHAATM